MKISGIICEYNPFHNGHLFHLDQTKKNGATYTVAVMSGNFVQRGEASLLPKTAKVQSAIENGIDLVIELPVPWAVARAEDFSNGAVSLLDHLGCVDELSFGSECGDIEALKSASRVLDDEEVFALTKKYLDSGAQYAAARSCAVREKYGEKYEKIISEPNNILGIGYIHSLAKFASGIQPFTIKRSGSSHDKTNENPFMKSASEIRRIILDEGPDGCSKALPQPTVNILREYVSIGQCPVDMKEWDKMILAVLRRLSLDEIARLPDISEGLEYRIYNAVKQSCHVDELIMRIKSKRYPLARIRRLILCAYLGIDKTFTQKLPPYIRVLGFNDRGREILKTAKETAKIPIVMKYSDIKGLDKFSQKVFEAECRSTDLYTLGFKKASPCGTEMIQNVIII